MARTHPGVAVIARRRKTCTTWWLRYRDPQTGKRVEVRAPDHKGARTREAIALSRRLRARPSTASPIIDALALHAAGLRRMAGTYRRAVEDFVRVAGVADTHAICREHLDAWRDELARSSAAPATRNQAMKYVAAVIRTWSRRGLCASLARDDVGDALRPFRVPRDPVRPYAVSELRAQREALGDTPLGRAWAFVLLSGLRRGEWLGLTRRDIDLERGVIVVVARKTARGRTVDMSVSPMLRGLCEEHADELLGWSVKRAQLARQRVGAEWTWQALRQTCASYLVCSGLLPPWRAAYQLGHSAEVADRHYRGLVRPHPGSTLEEVMGL